MCIKGLTDVLCSLGFSLIDKSSIHYTWVVSRPTIRTDVVVSGDVSELRWWVVVVRRAVVVGRAVVRADAQSLLVADRVTVVEPDALGPVQSRGVGGGQCRSAALRHGAVHRVLQSTTSIRKPVRYLNNTITPVRVYTHSNQPVLDNNVCNNPKNVKSRFFKFEKNTQNNVKRFERPALVHLLYVYL